MHSSICFRQFFNELFTGSRSLTAAAALVFLVMANNGNMIRIHRKRTVFPATPSQRRQIKLSPLDLQMLFTHYIQTGLIYQTPADNFPSQIDLLAQTLSRLLVEFYPMAGRFTTSSSDGAIYIDCNDSGVDFIEATAGHLSIADLTAPDVTAAVEELFALHGAVNLDGYRLPLLVIQVTQLKDGISVCCTVNHAMVDGVSLWNFFNSWALLCRTNGMKILLNPIHDRSLVNPGGSAVRLGLDPDGHIPRFSPPPLRVKMFLFSAHSIRRLKEQANRDSPVIISSFQALCGHVWRAVTRARGLGPEDPTTFRLSVDFRPRLLPPLPTSYFGNAIQSICATATARELNGLPLSFPAGLLNGIIAGHTDAVIRERIEMWKMEPIVYRFDMFEKNCLVMGCSPRFAMYENDFGWGEPVVVRNGSANHFDGKLSACPGKEGGGSVELEICLLPHRMDALEIDNDFLCP